MDIRRAFRKAVMDKLTADTDLQGLCGGTVQVTYRPTRKIGTFTASKRIAITFFDAGAAPDETVPLWERTLQLDVWSTAGLDLADKVAARIGVLLAGSENPTSSSSADAPLTLPAEPGSPGLVAHMQLQFVIDAWEQEGDLDRVTQTYTALVYQYPEGDR